ncbi:hypothetical protein QBC42DRAFT_320293 [Cladorrhinum samala]|uniref:Uncharacterized protein n=1 Tax=Cladorrhinum samala TaxID=585594 RepID=A0AAV9H9V1_9PEZI|nr:hypothetical protein QBC42DRAFT_320293 [Cladorrhinum samala]
MVSFTLLLTAFATLAAASPTSPPRTLTRRQESCECTRATIAVQGLDCQEVEDCHFCCHPLDAVTLETPGDCPGGCHDAHEELSCPANYEALHCGLH